MRTRIIFIAILAMMMILSLSTCSAPGAATLSAPTTVPATQPPAAPTATPLPPPTVTAEPLAAIAGAVFTGVFDMGDKAQKAEITLKVSEDGQAITSVKLDFTDITCEGFTQGFTKASVKIENAKLKTPIVDSKFEVTLAGLAEINGEITSPTTAGGTIRLLNSSSGLGSPTECGIWNWSATAQ